LSWLGYKYNHHALPSLGFIIKVVFYFRLQSLLRHLINQGVAVIYLIVLFV